jgi:predicted peptidase
MSAVLISVLMMEMALMQSDKAVSEFAERSYELATADGKQTYCYRLLKPAETEPGKTYPVVVFLHGAGERGDDNSKQLLYLPERMAEPAWRQKFPCFLIAPQCPAEKRWVEVPWEAHESTPMTDPTPQMLAVAGMLEELLKSEPADPRRVYLTGLSMGGYGVWDFAMRRPERFAAVAPVCAGGDESKAGRLAETPVWAFHGDADKTVPVERSRRMIEAIHAAGGKPKYTELPSVGHNSWNHAYSDASGLLEWMFQQENRKSRRR